MAFLQIISDNILPLLIFVAIGYCMDRRFRLDVSSLTKLTFYVVLPCFIFYSIYVAKIDMSMFHVFLLSFALMFILGFIGMAIGKIRGYSISKTEAFKNGTMFSNNGNIGIALIALVFSNAPYVVENALPDPGQCGGYHDAGTDEYVSQYPGPLPGREGETDTPGCPVCGLPYACALYPGGGVYY